MRRRAMLFCVLVALSSWSAEYPQPNEGDFVVRNFRFKSGEELAEVRIHYRTLGAAQRDANGQVSNAVLILHGTGGSGSQFLTDNFAGVLFAKGQLLDASRYFIILPDNIGHGRSSKPSDGLRMRFPHYEYDDMIELQYRLLTEGLKVNHLRLVMGTSMGGMHTWLWAEQHPDFMEAAMPLASLPVEIAGQNRILRRMLADSIRSDPEWREGEYKSQPTQGLSAALSILFIMSSSPLQLQKQAPARDSADALIASWKAARLKSADANDMLYYFDASRNYNPAPKLAAIRVPLTAINSADDLINPPELAIAEREIKRVKNGKFILLPITEQTRGHGTHSYPSIWQQHLAELLQRSEAN
ncbi:MAG: alpha/beta fold hydrolase [Acidobacteriales bacterium]|nr:alpha/beta fold hydrolase [Terriglobales bacterium]